MMCDRCFNKGNTQEYGNSKGGPNTDLGIGEGFLEEVMSKLGNEEVSSS